MGLSSAVHWAGTGHARFQGGGQASTRLAALPGRLTTTTEPPQKRRRKGDHGPSRGRQNILDWSDQAALRCLTVSLAADLFDLRLELREDRLCPTLPSRLNYWDFVDDLLKQDSAPEDATVVDIGTGASCIFPLLGAARHPRYHLIGTEVDASSVESARRLVTLNSWGERIEVRQVNNPKHLLVGVLDDVGASQKSPHRIHLVMTNPPFYASFDEGRHIPPDQVQRHRQ